ncbi:thioesterase domain-containing protein [Kitasatospora sp. NBC_00039]|uniref:thioesterase domain-containing protein n=1 Tax=Kitasatospora sp. NBC_00039 TaxID=2903565 RepID=UPI003866CBAB
MSAPTPAPTPAPVHGGPALTVLVADGAGEPLFLVLSEQFSDLEREAARGWETGRPVYTLSLEHDPGTNPGASPGVDPGADPAAEPWTATVPELAERFVGELLAVQPAGPYHLAGVGSGAVLAFELARQLRAHAREVGRVVLIKPPALPGSPVDFDLALRRRLALVVKRFGLGGEEDAEQVLALLSREGWYGADTGAADLARLQRVAAGLAWALSRYRPGACDVPVVLLQDEKEADAAELLWGRAAADLRPHWFDYGVEWFGPLLADPRVADVMKAELLT